MTESDDGFVYVATGGQVAKLIKVRMAPHQAFYILHFACARIIFLLQ
jgi:hypothetical protein